MVYEYQIKPQAAKARSRGPPCSAPDPLMTPISSGSAADAHPCLWAPGCVMAERAQATRMTEASANPYQAPTSVPTPNVAVDVPPHIQGMTLREITRLRNRSLSLRALGLLYLIFATFIAISTAFTTDRFIRALQNLNNPAALAMVVGYLTIIGMLMLLITAIICAWRRPGWGRVVLIIATSIFSLFGALSLIGGRLEPIALMIMLAWVAASIMGIITAARARFLFGHDRITHARLTKLHRELTHHGKRRL